VFHGLGCAYVEDEVKTRDNPLNKNVMRFE